MQHVRIKLIMFLIFTQPYFISESDLGWEQNCAMARANPLAARESKDVEIKVHHRTLTITFQISLMCVAGKIMIT